MRPTLTLRTSLSAPWTTTLAADIDAICRLTGEFTLRSGAGLGVLRQVPLRGRPALLLRVAREMVELVPDDTDLLGGLELGGVPIATMVSSLTGRPALFVRKKAKEYGTCKLAEGPDVAGRRVTLIEDVITTGGAVRDATNALRDAGAIVEVVVCAIDRSPEGENPLGRRRPRGAAGAHQGPARRCPRVAVRACRSRRPLGQLEVGGDLHGRCRALVPAVLEPLDDERHHGERQDRER